MRESFDPSYKSVTSLLSLLEDLGAISAHIDGVTSRADTALLLTAMEAARNKCSHGPVYDAMMVQGQLQMELPDFIPEPPNGMPGFITVYHGGWTLKQLKASIKGNLFPDLDEDYEKYVNPGYYSVQLLPVSADNVYQIQKSQPMTGVVASASVLALARLMQEAAREVDVFHGRRFRCMDNIGEENVVLSMFTDQEHMLHLMSANTERSGAAESDLCIASMFYHKS